MIKRKVIMFTKLQRRTFITKMAMFSSVFTLGLGNSAIAHHDEEAIEHHDEEAIQNSDQSPRDTTLNNTVSFRGGRLI